METESRLVVGGDWEEGSGEGLVHGYGVSLWSNENVLELDGGDGCTVL